MKAYFDPPNYARGLQQISYDNDQYRATIRNACGDVVLVSTRLETMSGAIKDSNYLGHYFACSEAAHIQRHREGAYA